MATLAELFESKQPPSIETLNGFTKKAMKMSLEAKNVRVVNWGRMQKSEIFEGLIIMWAEVNQLCTYEHDMFEIDMLKDARVKLQQPRWSSQFKAGGGDDDGAASACDSVAGGDRDGATGASSSG